TYFREPKKGAHDAVFDGFSPCRWCAFVEPMNVRNTDKVKISGVLVNEDVLKPGEYRARVTVFGEGARLYDETIPVTVKANSDSFVADSFEAEVPVNGAPEGTYKLKIVIAEGGHAVGEEEFYVYAPEKQRSGEVVLAGDDPALKSFLTARGLAVRDWKDRKGGEVIVASGAIEDLAAVMKAVEEGAKCVFLDGSAINEKPEVPGVGKFVHADMWLYHKDDTAMANHPFFKGLPTGLMDAFRYREVLRSFWWKGGATPDDLAAVGFNTSNGYGCGVTLGGYKHGAGMFYINALRIREEIGISPVAERILLNIIDALIA
ncbi:MAG: hypothetical protein J6U98_03030, partial [Abditibacteriota bacterium]|nr:hypothetical protein [Abditibacteriota bacterium]